ncbi:hypothetical protein SLS62_008088 [Diatrype stigma]|uniref:Heme haloperoxidase family profile domain-containing protein n=1 Tax=Diatrype stigma TaxID=117547 RepID=A0AAN9UKK1_9PEZI
MYGSTFLSLIAAAATVAALPHLGRSAEAAASSGINPWVAAGPSDSRGPCPMLNTLANHGYLPHSGRDITVQDIADAVVAGVNFDETFGQSLGAQAFQLLGGPETINLEDLGTPNVTEHRASLTRDDYPGGDNLHVDLSRLQALLADSDADYLDVASLAKSRVRVETLSGAPALTTTQETQAIGEAALLLLGMADGPVPAAPNTTTVAGVYDELRAPKDRVEAWFKTEKLPVAQGWQMSERALSLTDVRGLSLAIAGAEQALASS